MIVNIIIGLEMDFISNLHLMLERKMEPNNTDKKNNKPQNQKQKKNRKKDKSFSNPLSIFKNAKCIISSFHEKQIEQNRQIENGKTFQKAWSKLVFFFTLCGDVPQSPRCWGITSRGFSFVSVYVSPCANVQTCVCSGL